MLTDEQSRAIAQLIEKFESERNVQQSEADVRAGYIDLLFHALGWNVYNDPGQATNYRREGYVRGAGYVDVGLEIAGHPVLFLEAKRFGRIPASSERTGDRTTEEKQAFRYARGKKISYAILTNFERLHVFNADHERLILAFDHPRQYLDRLQDLWRLSPEQVEGGSLPWWDGQLEKKDIDLEFLAGLRRWRLLLANAIYQHNPDNPVLQRDGVFDFDALMAAVQRILDRLILVRYGDDKEVLLAHDLLDTMLVEYRNRGAYARPDHLMRAFIDLSHMMDEHHNTSLFAPGHVCEQVSVPNPVLADVIDEMNGISFRKFSSDILGNTYESYLGTKLALRNGAIGDEERRDIRKGRGIYYTPRWVVEYIVDNTLGRRLQELEQEHGLSAIEEVRGLAVLDPACGSGSFLIYAYQVLADFYRRANRAVESEHARLLEQLKTPQMDDFLEQFKRLPQPVLDFPQVILQEHLYGVDLDPEAAEIAAVNLTMQAFADSRREKLPLILNENIKVGNSLISGSDDELRPHFGDAWQDKRPFNWDQEFADIMARGGFDIVVGNPPYIRLHKMPDADRDWFFEHFDTARNKCDVYGFFVERCASLLEEGGRLGFIVPNTWCALDSFQPLRDFIMGTFTIEEVSSLENPFHESTVSPVILALRKTLAPEAREENLIVHKEFGPPAGRAMPQTAHATTQIPQGLLASAPRQLVNLSWTPEYNRLTERIARVSLPLGELCILSFGIKTGDDSKFLVRQTTSQDDKPVLRGRNIHRYGFVWEGEYVRYLPDEMKKKPIARPGDKQRFETPEKIILQGRSGRELAAAYDTDSYYTLGTTHLIRPRRPEFPIKYVLGLINSKLMTFWYGSQFITSTQSESELASLPIRDTTTLSEKQNDMPARIVELTERMLDLHQRLAAKGDVHDNEREQIQRDIARTDREIDDLVYDLYGLTAEERALVEAEIRR